MSKVLILLGPVLCDKDKVGGIVTLFQNLIEEVSKKNINYQVFDINGSNYLLPHFLLLKLFFYLFKNRKNNIHLSLHGTANHYFWIGLILLFFNRFYSISYDTRKFAGNFYGVFRLSSKLKKIVYFNLLKYSDANFFETKFLTKKFSKINSKTFFFPNVRKKNLDYVKEPFEKNNVKILFLSQIIFEKGIFDFINLARVMYHYNFYIAGPNIQKIDFQDQTLPKNIHYLGCIDHDKVIHLLASVDLLVFPSFYKGEGYPGVIIESYSCGTPVVASNWMSIHELFDDSNFLFNPGDIPQMVSCINYTLKDYDRNSRRVLRLFNNYESSLCTSNYLSYIGF